MVAATHHNTIYNAESLAAASKTNLTAAMAKYAARLRNWVAKSVIGIADPR